MRYSLNASLIYNATDGTLTLPGSNEPDSQLSITASALLYFFLCNRGVVCREEILKKVWDDNGLTSSNSNLNQYLSMLRKTFRHYQIDNIILTISRGHLQLNPAIAIEALDDPPGTEPPPRQEISAPPAAEHQPQSLRPCPVCWYMASAFLFLLALLLLFFSFAGSGDAPSVALTRTEYGQCVLLESEDMLRSGPVAARGKNFTNVRQRLKLDCKPGERFVFFYGEKLQPDNLGRVFLAHCAANKDDPFSYCASYFYYAWKAT
ncbi:transcriptional regulator [Kalamiella sp. sgz302252]|uniref:winged helix-turn-helix domain-containing protein n=1 Tax=Pantoea sp. sgz302252 TaxID=3341827 RepID=UPI0036D22ADE